MWDHRQPLKISTRSSLPPEHRGCREQLWGLGGDLRAGVQTMGAGPIQPTAYLCTACKLRMFLHLNSWKKNEQKNNILWHIKIISDSNFSAHKYCFIGMKTINLFLYCPWHCFCSQWQSWLVAKETIWPRKPKIFTIWHFTEKVCWTVVQENSRATSWEVIWF